jgi:hypothetical protein
MTLAETLEKINDLQLLVGQKVPRWGSPILEIIPAPTSSKFASYIKVYRETQDVKKAIDGVGVTQFDVLLIFRTPPLHGDLVYEWYSFFYK